MLGVFLAANLSLLSLYYSAFVPRGMSVATSVCGYSAEGRPIDATEIRDADIPIEHLIRVAVICRQHGDEPETSDAGHELISRLTSLDDTDSWLAKRVAVLIIPVANPDGAERMQRTNSLGQDLNRDWGRRRTLEVEAISATLVPWRPQLVIDVHQWVPGDSCQTPLAESAGGAVSARIVRSMHHACASCGYSLLATHWSGGGDALCHRYWGISRAIPAILLETVHRHESPAASEAAIQTSVVALMEAIRLMAGRNTERQPPVMIPEPGQEPDLDSSERAEHRIARAARRKMPTRSGPAVVKTMTGIVVQVSPLDQAIVIAPVRAKGAAEDDGAATTVVVHVDGKTKIKSQNTLVGGTISGIEPGDTVTVSAITIGNATTATTIELVSKRF